VSTGTIAAADGVALHWRRADPTGPPRGVILLVHGYAEHCGRYEEFFTHFTARGLAVVALDLRGHGRSGGPRGHCLDFAEMVADVRALAAEAEQWWPQVPRLLFGHSMGGLVSLCYLLAHQDTVRAAALSGPAVRVPNAGPAWLRAVARAVGKIAPRTRFRSSLDAAALARDPAVGEAYVADPLVHRVATAGLVGAVERAQAAVLRDAAELRVPLLILQGDADRLVDPAGARELAARLTGPHELVMLPGYYHELLNEPPAERARVLDRLDRWYDRWL
jgi:alpha-beta hydrolase superfamily lysophospholipase